ncbi:sulfatase-like hydrolase/transferase [Paenibacillus sp. GCM10023248]|uniref:sulfatase-like hydrolase/transferase n=1 Tax=unclassified Paenibacillus TaxID=185978 RepID=UPI002379F9FC|nr:sulfatase-like hydrolase/transferase [Paenibacillus sp. MAHUQ-63]MDD9268854.1 sulfatase-like hydrolase/transferase [Paenibacillus sp. MAHUQ-63]
MTEPVKQPNLLVIMADQLRYDCLGYSGLAPVQTPHLDSLAAGGMWFENAYNHIPICGPARQSFVCGRRPESFGGLWNYSLGLQVGALAPTNFSWARSVHDAGYVNGYIGKWDVHPSFDPTHYGYTYYVSSDDRYRKLLKERYPELAYKAGYFGETDPLPLADTRTHKTAEMACGLMRQLAATDGPWQLRVNFQEPHLPCRPAAEFAAMYTPDSIPEWGSFGETFADKPYIQKQQLRNWGIEHYEWPDWAPIVARYYAVISQLDDAVGKLLAELDALGQGGDTVVVFTTDHGDMCGGHRMLDKHYVLYEDVVKVPLIVRWPGVVAPGSRCERFVYNLLDLPPTMLAIAGAGLPEGGGDRLHGESLLPLLQGAEPDQWRDEVVASFNGAQFGLFTQRMIRTREWKYVWNCTDVDELYDLRSDPHELHNVIGHPGSRRITAELRKRLYHILLADGDGIVRNEWMRGQLLEGRKA